MFSPLPEGRNVEDLPDGANRGLYFNKFVNRWPENPCLGTFKGLETRKKDWLKKFAGGVDASTAEASRIKSLAEALDGNACNYISTGPFVTGMGLEHPVENGFLFHHTLGVPYLPGSSIKGMIRAWAENWCALEEKDEDYKNHIDEIWRLFGGPIVRGKKEIRSAGVGSLIIFDALPVSKVTLYTEVLTPHNGDWRITDKPLENPPADWVSPTPIPFLAVKEGAMFQFAMAPRTPADADLLEPAFVYLQDALEWIGAGAKTAVGFGRFLSEEAITLQEAEAPPEENDRVRVLETYEKAKLRGREGKCMGYNEFGEILIGWDGGGMSAVQPNEVEKILS